MESFGEKLRTTRENLGYSIEQIARDTHIAKRYLHALEDEDFSLFPGETYLKGFLQNYSEYLGLDPEEMITIYRHMKIQEQPIPMDQLLDQKLLYKRRPLIFGIIGGIIVIAAVIFLLIHFNPFADHLGSLGDENNKDEIVFTGEKMSVDMTRGMAIVLTLHDVKQTLTAQKVEEKGITFGAQTGIESLIIGEEKYFDLDEDGTPDLSVFLTEIFKEQNQNKARITLQQPLMGDTQDIIARASDLELIERGIAKILLESHSVNSFTVNMTVVRDCFIIYYTDANPREEKMAYKGDTISLQADQSADLRLSDGGSVKLIIADNELDSGPSNQLFATQIRWVKNTTGEYQLVAFPAK